MTSRRVRIGMTWFLDRPVAALPAATRTPESVVAPSKVMNPGLQPALESCASLASRMKILDQRIKDATAALDAALDQDRQA